MNYKNTLHAVALITATSIASISTAHAELITSDFLFGSGTPFGGTTIIDGIEVTLTTTNTQPFGTRAFRDLLNTSPSFVTFDFSSAISEFQLSVSRILPPDEFLTDFNIGLPALLTGDLVILDGVITSSQPGDFGDGTLYWSGLNTTSVTFTIGNLLDSTARPALAVNEFGINAVPVPAAVWLFSSGLLGLVAVAKRKA